MSRKTTLAVASVLVTLGALALTASRKAAAFSLECGSLDLPAGQVLIRIPTDPTGLRVDIATASVLQLVGEPRTGELYGA